MKLSRLNNDDIKLKNPVVTIGSYDGVHLGHKKIIEKITNDAKAINGDSAIISFDPHPRLVLSQNTSFEFKVLSTIKEKEQLLEKCGIDCLYLIAFDENFASWSALKFIEEILIKKLNVSKVIIGYNHRFGNNREGDIRFLEKIGKQFDFEVEEIPKQLIDEITVSSSKIRILIQNCQIKEANYLLGHNYSFEGQVCHGQKLGGKLGFPTANIQIKDIHKLIPGDGVYAIKASFNNTSIDGMMHIGHKPSLNTSKHSIEAHLFNFNQDIYNETLCIQCIDYIRPNKRFENLDALKAQLAEDKISCVNILSN